MMLPSSFECAARFACAGAMLLALLAPSAALARPLYFENLTTIYSIQPDESIYACGVCHEKWLGTGARNPYGTAVEQQLYIGKSIVQAIEDVAGDDTDGDGFTNGDELATYRTLPGYSCANYSIAQDPPADFQSLITPGVASCLEPKDIKLDPIVISFVTKIGDTSTATLQLINNGSDFPIEVTDVSLLPGAPPSLTIDVPPLPLSIPVGQSVPVPVHFSPTDSLLTSATLRVTSDDPDEGQIDVSVGMLSFLQPLAPPDVRGACLKDLEKQLERLNKVRLRAWGTCYLDELRGVACDTGRRDIAVAKAEAKLRALIGGEHDTHCTANALSPSLLGLPPKCGTPCDSISLSTMPALADCAVCRQTAATDAMLGAAVGTVPPDLPPNRLGSSAWRCNQQLVTGIQNSIRSVQKALGSCELDAVQASASVDCAADQVSTLAKAAAQVDVRAGKCTDTTAMLGCLFVPGADPHCLGAAAVQIGTDLVDTVFGTD
jgi:hypothetical protein